MRTNKLPLPISIIAALMLISMAFLSAFAAETPSVDEASPSPQNDAAGFPAPTDEASTDSLEYASVPLNVMLPTSVVITIDPFEISKKGHVHSGTYAIKNLGDTDVLISFTDMRVTFANDRDFEALALPFDESGESKLKSLYLLLDFGRNDADPIVLTDKARENEASFSIRAAQNDPDGADSLSLSFSGSVNHAPAVEWKAGDVSIRLTYLIRAVPPIETESETPPDELPEEANGDTATPWTEENRPVDDAESPAAPANRPSDGPPVRPALPETPVTEEPAATTQGALSGSPPASRIETTYSVRNGFRKSGEADFT